MWLDKCITVRQYKLASMSIDTATLVTAVQPSTDDTDLWNDSLLSPFFMSESLFSFRNKPNHNTWGGELWHNYSCWLNQLACNLIIMRLTIIVYNENPGLVRNQWDTSWSISKAYCQCCPCFLVCFCIFFFCFWVWPSLLASGYLVIVLHYCVNLLK